MTIGSGDTRGEATATAAALPAKRIDVARLAPYVAWTGAAIGSAGLLVTWLYLHVLGTDFSVVWDAGGRPLDAVYRAGDRYPFAYPPTGLFFFRWIHSIPLEAAFAGWVAASLAIYLWACRALQGRVVALAVASPPLVAGLATGQPSVVLSALVILACGARHPALVGIGVGLVASIKPQLVMLAPLFLAVRREWIALAAAGATCALVVALSLLVLGPSVWLAWFGAMPDFARALDQLEFGSVVVSPIGTALLLGLPVIPIAALAIMLALAVTLRAAPRDGVDTAATIGVASLLCSPYAMPYDFAILAPYLAREVYRGSNVAALCIPASLNPLPVLAIAAKLAHRAKGPAQAPAPSPAGRP